MKLSHNNLRRITSFILYLLLIIPVSCFVVGPGKIKTLVVTGGHEFDRTSFYDMFDSYSNIEYLEIKHPDANNIYLSDTIEKFDVIIFYDLYQEINEAQKMAFISLLKKGKGLVFLHHCLGSYQDWDEFLNILGGRYYLQPIINSKNKLVSSTFKHNTDITFQIADKEHPVTKGINQIKIHGEGYNNIEILSTVQPLLYNLHPECEEIAGWVNNYEKARIVYIQPGHDNNAYNNKNYRKIVYQAIIWASNYK